MPIDIFVLARQASINQKTAIYRYNRLKQTKKDNVPKIRELYRRICQCRERIHELNIIMKKTQEKASKFIDTTLESTPSEDEIRLLLRLIRCFAPERMEKILSIFEAEILSPPTINIDDVISSPFDITPSSTTMVNNATIDENENRSKNITTSRPFRRSSLQNTDFRARYFHTLSLAPSQSVPALHRLDERIAEGATTITSNDNTIDNNTNKSSKDSLLYHSKTIDHYSSDTESTQKKGIINEINSDDEITHIKSNKSITKRIKNRKRNNSAAREQFIQELVDDEVMDQNIISQEPLSYTQVASKILEPEISIILPRKKTNHITPGWMKNQNTISSSSIDNIIDTNTSTVLSSSIQLNPTLTSKSIQQFTNLSTTLNQLGSQHLDQDLHFISQLLEAFDAGIP